ncbi:MAG: hypothetical protein ACI4W6_09150, partial [Acutalibacteraceae bacterium]
MSFFSTNCPSAQTKEATFPRGQYGQTDLFAIPREYTVGACRINKKSAGFIFLRQNCFLCYFSILHGKLGDEFLTEGRER